MHILFIVKMLPILYHTLVKIIFKYISVHTQFRNIAIDETLQLILTTLIIYMYEINSTFLA